LASLHQCYCGTTAESEFSLTRCSQCKATYYCSPNHQKEHWGSAHRDFCPELQRIVTGGFPAIREYMKVFSPLNMPNVTPQLAFEGWSIVLSALEKEVYTSPYEEAKLLHWAGTCHAILSGITMRERHGEQAGGDYVRLMKYFTPSMNFFYEAIRVATGSEREIEVGHFSYCFGVMFS